MGEKTNISFVYSNIPGCIITPLRQVCYPHFSDEKAGGEISSLPKVTEIVVVEMVFEASCLISKLKLFHSGM